MANSISVSGKVAIVTGAGSGVGRGIARVLAQNGAKVIIVDIGESRAKETANQISKAGGSSAPFMADVSRWNDMQKMAEFTVKEYGRIDILCENAGIYPFGKIEDADEELWDRVMAVNLKSCFLGLKSCLPHMINEKYGRVVLTSSITGYRTGVVGLSHYSASKAGMIGFMRSAALELAKNNITVNAVEPGAIVTEGTFGSRRDSVKRQESLTPTGKLSTPEDVGNAVLFLASDAAANITGQTIVIDGGRSIVE